jgi:N-methylhydantoinase A/oxoprolinase/acetone carboxylase beta subunit
MRMIGIDVGGTFTDLVFADTGTGRVAIHKVSTTPDDPSRGMLAGMEALCARVGVAPGEIDTVLHATTIATNAVLEHDGCEAGMITTAGFRDVLHIGRHQRPQHYSIRQEIPSQVRPLVKRRHRLTVRERLTADRATVLEPLDEDAVRAAARALKAAGVEAIAVCFLFSYLNPTHERRAAALVREEYPGCFVSASADVAPQFREFERFTTAAMNAFIGPKVRRYVSRLADELASRGLAADLRIMRSNGGLATAALIAELPVLTLLSGPAAGVLGGAWSGALSGRRNCITFDIGGTSADIGIVRDGVFIEAAARDTSIGGYPVLVPMLDIHTIGAGGGSIAHLDAAGAFRVGPRSAGAVPGPAAYGRGGTLPTVTDANLYLGRLDAAHVLGGAMRLDGAAAARVIEALADQLRLSPLAAAEGVLTVINANMANAIRSRTVEKGLDPRDFCLVAFGGAGPLHGAEVAGLLGIPEVLVPASPGICSAMGLMTTDLKYDTVRTVFARSDKLDPAELADDFAAMQADLEAQVTADGIAVAAAAFSRAADLRYLGQGYELRVAVPDGRLSDGLLAEMVANFHARHAAEYGHAFAAKPVEVVNVRLTATAPHDKLAAVPAPAGGALEAALVRRAPCVFRTAGGLREFETPRYERERLPIDTPIPGPVIVLQTDSTTVVPPGATLIALRDGNLLIRLGADA